MKNLNLENVQEAKDFTPVPPDGYICRITSVEDVPDKEYLRVEFDIAEGDFKGNYQTLYENKGFWGGSFVRSYKEKALPFFKSFTTAIENSNPATNLIMTKISCAINWSVCACRRRVCRKR